MFNAKNRVQLIGFVGCTPEIKTLETGKKLARFAVATTEMYRNAKGEKVEDTQWHNIVVWGKLAEVIEKFVSKGTAVVLGGKIVNRNYTDKDGQKKYITEIQAGEVIILGRKTQEG